MNFITLHHGLSRSKNNFYRLATTKKRDKMSLQGVTRRYINFLSFKLIKASNNVLLASKLLLTFGSL